MLFSNVALILFGLAMSGASATSDDRFIQYGEKIYLQNNGMDFRWLSGARSGGNKFVITHNHLGSDYELGRAARTYQWIIRSRVDFESDYADDDVKEGECLRYGDVFYLQNVGRTDRLLSGSRSKGNELVTTLDMLGSDYEYNRVGKTYKWVARSNSGYGALSNQNNEDAAHGKCIEDLSVVFLQNMAMRNRWLSGSRSGGNELVIARNMFQSTYEQTKVGPSYTWIMRKQLGDGGDRSEALECSATNSRGRWIPIKFADADQGTTEQTVEYKQGVERSDERSVEESSSWQLSVTSTITAGFEYAGASASASLEVSAGIAGSYTETATNAVTEIAEKTYTTTFGPGQVWQFQWDVQDICLSDSWGLKTDDLVLTAGRREPPCCLPGYAIDKEHGPCHPGTPCSCSEEVCNVGGEGRHLEGGNGEIEYAGEMKESATFLRGGQ